MALADYVPVILFTISAVILMRDLYNKMSKGAFALFAAGLIDVTCAGALKATYKLLYAADICDFEALSDLFFPMQSLGFLLAGIGALAMLCHKQSSDASEGSLPAAVLVPALFKGTFVFVGLIVAGLAMLDVSLCALSRKLKKPGLIAVFILSFIFALCMGYLSSKDFAEASMNWIAEGVNMAAWGLFLLGVVTAHKNGLAGLKLRGGETV